MTRGYRGWALVTAVVVVVEVCGCGSTKAGITTAGSTVPNSPALKGQEANGDCTSGRSDADIRVTIFGHGQAACIRWNEVAAKSSEQFWQVINTEPHGTPVCSMEQGSEIIEVREGDFVNQGNTICARLLAAGAHEVEGPGERDEREQRETEAHQKEAAEQQATVERDHREALAAKEQAAETKQHEKEEASQKRQEAQEHAKENREHQEEEAKQHQEEAQQHQELEREDHRNEEETHRAEREAQQGG